MIITSKKSFSKTPPSQPSEQPGEQPEDARNGDSDKREQPAHGGAEVKTFDEISRFLKKPESPKLLKILPASTYHSPPHLRHGGGYQAKNAGREGSAKRSKNSADGDAEVKSSGHFLRLFLSISSFPKPFSVFPPAKYH